MTSPPNHKGDDSSLRRKTAAHPALLLCPFCGSRPIVTPGVGKGARNLLIQCESDDCAIKSSVGFFPKAFAIAAWNSRAPVTTEAGAERSEATNNPADSRIAALEEALREAVERRDYFAKEILQSCIYARRDQWCASINCRCQQARRALGPEGETHE